ncbi:MAG: hypothetical protein LBJ16_03305, partial [Holosporaceae bacterium]|nr:hypothetical protein [Holosporaceae bacterium]
KNTWRRFPISNNGAVCYNGQVIKEKEASGTVRLADEKRDWIFTNSTGTVTISGLFIKNRLQLLKGVTVSYRDGGFFYGLSLPEAAGNTNPDIDISSQWINDIPRWLVSGDKKTENILLAGVGGPGGNASSVSHVLLFSKAQNSFSYFGSVHRYSRCNNCNNIVVPNGDGLMIIEGKKGDDELVVNRGRFKNGELVSGTTAKVTRTKVTRKK